MFTNQMCIFYKIYLHIFIRTFKSKGESNMFGIILMQTFFLWDEHFTSIMTSQPTLGFAPEK